MDPASSDVFSLSDHLLAERLQFVKEIGFGNWGSVWLCRPKSSSGKVKDIEVAVKLVHRSKTSTTAARVRSLWNEMKIVRSFKNDPHPSIVPFHSFIITPSYALITMAYLPTPVPVEVSEPRAKQWFRSLLSGVHFLHSRGVVHNDIKPANILLSPTNVPVLVDFGFAEKYDLDSPKAFHSNLTYGTPEYLSPERARGLPHDTRKADIWSLGITFFEILVGRTPFEYEEGEVFEKKEDLERYWHRTMRGKWVGQYSLSQPVERFLKRMIVPNADLRCTAAEIMTDPYWDASPATPIRNHRKSVSAAVPTSARTNSFINSFKDSFKDREREKETSPLRRIDISLPWSASRSPSRSSVSRPASRMETPPRSASRIGTSPRPALRSKCPPTATSAAPSQSQASQPFSEAPVTLDHLAKSPTSVSPAVRTRTHSRSLSQPKVHPPPGILNVARVRKLSTVQASPIRKLQPHLSEGPEVDEKRKVNTRNGCANARLAQTSISFNSNSPLRRPLGPRQPSPRVIPQVFSGSEKDSPLRSGQTETPEKRHDLSHLVQSRASEVDHTRMRIRAAHLSNVPHTPTSNVANRTSLGTPQAVRLTPVLKQLSGKPPRTRRRAGVLADLTGFARNVDLGAHGVGRPVKHVRERKDKGKENIRAHTSLQKENKENDALSSKDARAPNKHTAPAPFPVKISTKEHDLSAKSVSHTANLSTVTGVTRGSVRDRMMDWERERERLREMVMTDTSADGHGDQGSTILTRTSAGSDPDDDNDDDDESRVEAEVIAEVASQAMTKVPLPVQDKPTRMMPVEDETRKGVTVNAEGKRPTTAQTVTTISSSSSKMERSQIEVARLAVRSSAQILSSHNGSISVLALGQTAGKQSPEMNQVKNDAVTDIGLPVDNRNGEWAFTSLKQSVKASIDKGMRLYKSSTLGQFTGRNTPVWGTSAEPIDFEQRRSGEEGRFSWENIRPEHEVAADRMNSWIQNVEKVVEETRQNFASTTVIPPAPLPLAPLSRSSSPYHGTLNTPPPTQNGNTNHNNNSLNMSRASRLPRRLLAANEIFAECTDPNAPLSPASRRGDLSTSYSYIHTPESSVPVLPSISMLMQTPRRRRATISTRSPTQTKVGLTTNDTFDGSPSKRREKSKSQTNLDKHIKDIAKLELELSQVPVSSPSPRLSAVLDRSLFVAPVSPRYIEDSAATPGATRTRSTPFDDLNASPCHVEPYPPRKSGEQTALDIPDRQHLEGVYDRFLMATSGVKRVGKGYQSDNPRPVQNITNTIEPVKSSQTRGFGVFGTARRPMPPPVSSDDAWRRSTSIDEFGFITASTGSSQTSKDENKRTFVRRAIRAMVPGKAASRRLSRTIVV